MNAPPYSRYPLGSVFKLITVGAGLESGLLHPSQNTTTSTSSMKSPAPFDRLDYEYFQEDGITLPSGILTLPQGIIRL